MRHTWKKKSTAWHVTIRHALFIEWYVCLFFGRCCCCCCEKTTTKKGSQRGFAMRKEVDQNPTCTNKYKCFFFFLFCAYSQNHWNICIRLHLDGLHLALSHTRSHTWPRWTVANSQQFYYFRMYVYKKTKHTKLSTRKETVLLTCMCVRAHAERDFTLNTWMRECEWPQTHKHTHQNSFKACMCTHLQIAGQIQCTRRHTYNWNLYVHTHTNTRVRARTLAPHLLKTQYIEIVQYVCDENYYG